MRKVWFVLPSRRPAAQALPVLHEWQERGYTVLVQRDHDDRESLPGFQCLLRPYQGYAEAVNYLTRVALAHNQEARWIVTAGDDTLPDPHHTADEIAAQCEEHFARLHAGAAAAPGVDLSVDSLRAAARGVSMATFGIMQCTGDRWESNGPGKCGIDMVAGSPWMGRAWCERAFQGKGPLPPHGFYHCFADELLQEVATRLGVFWQRRDLVHKHNHWALPQGNERMGQGSRMPAFLARANSAEEWKRGKELIAKIRAEGYPGCDPL